jgi:hypothetical protein
MLVMWDRAIGGKVNQFDNDKELCRRVGVEYTLSGAEAMRARLAATRTSRGQPFRFVFCSGRHAEWDGKKPLLFLADSRRYKGEVERGLCALADDAAAAGSFEVLIARPSGLVAPDANAAKKVFSPLYHGLRTAQLGRAMVRMAVEGWKDRIVENEVLMKM